MLKKVMFLFFVMCCIMSTVLFSTNSSFANKSINSELKFMKEQYRRVNWRDYNSEALRHYLTNPVRPLSYEDKIVLPYKRVFDILDRFLTKSEFNNADVRPFSILLDNIFVMKEVYLKWLCVSEEDAEKIVRIARYYEQ